MVQLSRWWSLCKDAEVCTEHREVFDQIIIPIIHNKGVYKEALNLKKAVEKISEELTDYWLRTILSMIQGKSGLIYYQRTRTKQGQKLMDYNWQFREAMEPFHYLANLTGPKYKGYRWSPEWEE